jgi:peptidoglycan/xylan/chitin deacetylase (PgdA/CDA1 family)
VRTVEKAVILLPAAAGAYAAPVCSLLPAGAFPFRARTRVGGERVALTFDDGPDRGTELFLDVLERAGVRATFFAVGEQVELAPARLKEIASRGHEIGLHCYRHRNHLRLGPKQTLEDMHRGAAVIEDILGRRVGLFRPPYGVFNAASWYGAGRMGYGRVLWSRWGKDWEAGATAASVLQNVGYPEAGDVVLLHDSDRYASPGSWRNTLAALPELLERIAERGLEAGPVGEAG